jgi:SPP1 gp7 family putative phage head morphogenesis protein
MPKNKYWQDRFIRLQESQLKKGERYYADLEDQYLKASMRIEKQIAGWYQRFADNNQISLTEAKVMLTGRDLKEFKWDVKEYIKNGEINALDQSWMKELENASARVHVSRLEALKLQMQQQVEVLYGNHSDDMDMLMKKIYEDGYYHTAFEIQRGFNVGYDLHKLNADQLQKIIAKPWTVDNKTFSDRVWTSKQELINSVHTVLTQGIIRGDSPDEAIRAIAKQFGVHRNKAGRLIMTESAFFASAAQRDCFKGLDVEQFEVVATLDSHTSELCQGLDGHIFKMDDFEVGSTAPPFHVWCRSVTVPYFEDNVGERAARGADGKTYFVPSDMTYEDWKKKFVDQTSPKGDIIKNKQIIPKTVEDIADNITKVAGLKNPADLLGVDLEVAKGIEESYVKVMNKFPQLKGEFHSLGVNEQRSSTYASCYVYSGRINVNPKYFGDLQKIEKSFTGDVGSGFHPKGTDWKSIVTHELGHAVDGFLSRNGHGELSGYTMKSSSYKMRKQVLKELKLAKKDISSEVSRYGSKDDDEFFAECFAEYMESNEPRRVAKKFGEILEEWMKGLVK